MQLGLTLTPIYTFKFSLVDIRGLHCVVADSILGFFVTANKRPGMNSSHTLNADQLVAKLCEKTSASASAQPARNPQRTVIATKHNSDRLVGDALNRTLNIYVTHEFVDAAEPDDEWSQAFSGNKGQLVLRPVEEKLASVILSFNHHRQTTFTLRHKDPMLSAVQTLPLPSYGPIYPHSRQVIPVLSALFYWDWHLHLVPDRPLFQETVDVEFYKLEFTGEYEDEGGPILVPTGENLIVDGVVDIVAVTEHYYGIRVNNRSQRDLYVYLFVFSATSLEIFQGAASSSGGRLDPTDPTLPRGSTYTIGYGGGGQPPFMFSLDDGVDLDVDFFKLFVSVDPVDFQSLQQGSPFSGRRTVPNRAVEDFFTGNSLWDAFTITLVQRRHPKQKEPTTSLPHEVMNPPETVPNRTSASAPASDPVSTTRPPFYTKSTETPLWVRARSPAAVKQAWFYTPPLTQEFLHSLHCMRLRTLAKQQGPPGATATTLTGAYFEVSIIGNNGDPKMSGGQPIAYRSHSAPAKSANELTDGKLFTKDDELLSKLQAGDCLEVSVCARGRGWMNDADEGHLMFW
ncbi:unnamed protein product [Rhizoctonia solani]|uniref:Uncharacterized protein n=1 Tax=Rhizoctonia solani TaxID=456999 RepID=A0A8H2XA97_9AGAM|nr:unnamed protein product [Rhizoctonia solani]